MYNNLFGTYASRGVKKPTPVTTQTLVWNQLGERKLNRWEQGSLRAEDTRITYENLALSTLAKAGGNWPLFRLFREGQPVNRLTLSERAFVKDWHGTFDNC